MQIVTIFWPVSIFKGVKNLSHIVRRVSIQEAQNLKYGEEKWHTPNGDKTVLSFDLHMSVVITPKKQ